MVMIWAYIQGWWAAVRRTNKYIGRHRRGWMLPHPLSWSSDNVHATHLITWRNSD